jgi:hypothetical protein
MLFPYYKIRRYGWLVAACFHWRDILQELIARLIGLTLGFGARRLSKLQRGIAENEEA